MMLAIVIGLLLFLIIIGIPIGIALLATSLVYFFMLGMPLSVVVQQMLQGASSFILIALPLFILAGMLMNEAGITTRILRFAAALLGTLRGALAQVNIFTSLIFSGVSGDAISDTAGLGSIFIPEMKKQGYSKEFSAAVTASSAVVGPIIPPSIPLIIVGSLAGVSVGQLFLGGLIPGVIFIIGAMVFTYLLSARRGFPRSRPQSTEGIGAYLQELRDSFFGAAPALLAPVIIIGGIVSGIVTVTEAGVIAVIYVFILGSLVYREFNWRTLVRQVVPSTIVTTGAIMFILSLAGVYTNLLTRERVAQIVSDTLFTLTDSNTVVLLLVVFAAVLIGSVLSTTPALLLLIPVVVPLVAQLETDAVHFYVIVTIALCTGTISPPVGLNLYVAAQIGEAAPEKVFVSALPYILILLGIVVLCVFVPDLVMFLPQTQVSP